jgi:MFS transporter, NNP family, nitrate/nitrite transporter
MSNGATYSVVPFINQKAMGAVSGIVGAGGNVGAVMAGFLFTSETVSYRESLFTIGIAVTLVSFVALALTFIKKSTPHTVQETLESKPALEQPVLEEAIA